MSAERRRGRPPGGGAGRLLLAIRNGQADTKAELGARTGFARATVAKELTRLLNAGLVLPMGERISPQAGRPAARFVFNRHAGVVLVADLGVTGAHLAVCDLAGEPLADVEDALDLGRGADHGLTWIEAAFSSLLKQAGKTTRDVRGVGFGLPGPVHPISQEPLQPLPGWPGRALNEFVARTYGVPLVADAAVNMMTVAEHRALAESETDMLFVKVATHITCGLVLRGQLFRGAHNAAGNVGHVRIAPRTAGHGELSLEDALGGAALAKALTKRGLKASSSRDVVKLLRARHPEAVQLVRQAGRGVGTALAALVDVLNPGAIVLGGDYADVEDHLLGGVRESIHLDALSATTRHLRILQGRLGARAGILGAAQMTIDTVLAPAAVDQALASL